MSYEKQTMLVLSTGHITQEDSDRLNDWAAYPADAPGLLAGYEYGWMIWVSPDVSCLVDNLKFYRDQKASDALLELMMLAQREGCDWLRLDCDGPTRDDLPQFDW